MPSLLLLHSLESNFIVSHELSQYFEQAMKVLQKSEQMARNEYTLNYNENATFVIDCKDFVPIYNGEECMKCSFCGSAYKGSAMKGKLCVTDGFCTVGVETIGLVTGK